MGRLASHFVVSGLLRAAEALGGNGAILARGDRDAGALLLVLTTRGGAPKMMERVSALDGGFTWNQVESRSELRSNDSVARFVDEKKRFDRDIWVVELDIPNVEQFIADSLG